MDPCRSNIGGGPDPCDPCGVDAYDDDDDDDDDKWSVISANQQLHLCVNRLVYAQLLLTISGRLHSVDRYFNSIFYIMKV